MYVNAQTIITIAALLTAIGAIVTLIWKVFRWFERQKKQDVEISSIKEELCLLTYGLLACLKGLEEQGCDGPVKDGINRIEKHLNQKAHSQK